MTRVESIRGSRAFQIIKEQKKIHRFDLMEKLGISLSAYEKFKPLFEYKYGTAVSYDKKTQEWVFHDVEE